VRVNLPVYEHQPREISQMCCVINLIGDLDVSLSIQVDEAEQITFEFLLSWTSVLNLRKFGCSNSMSLQNRRFIISFYVFISCYEILGCYLVVCPWRTRNIVFIFKNCNRLNMFNRLVILLILVDSLRHICMLEEVGSFTVALIV
jgi:hypothetical protein